MQAGRYTQLRAQRPRAMGLSLLTTERAGAPEFARELIDIMSTGPRIL